MYTLYITTHGEREVYTVETLRQAQMLVDGAKLCGATSCMAFHDGSLAGYLCFSKKQYN